MERGLLPGAGFFDDGSSDSEWEDSEGDITQTFAIDGGFGLRNPPYSTGDQESMRRGRIRERSTIASLPHFSGPSSVHDPGLGVRYDEINSNQADAKSAKRARHMSLRRLNMDNVRVVQTRSRAGTPRDSLRSAGSDTPSLADANKPFPQLTRLRHSEELPPQNPMSKGRHRRNTSGSMIADSIINAHVMTMRALESLNSPVGSTTLPSAQEKQQNYKFPLSAAPVTHNNNKNNNSKSLSTSRHITLSPLSIAHHQHHNDRDRPPHLPAHLVKTPYPFSAKKDFPKPKTRPRRRGLSDGAIKVWSNDDEYTRLDSGYGGEVEKDGQGEIRYNDAKGKHVLGLVDGSVADTRSRMQRNESAQGVIRSRVGSGSEEEEEDGAVWVSVVRAGWRRTDFGAAQSGKELFKIVIPRNFTLTHQNDGFPSNSSEKKTPCWIHRKRTQQSVHVDFDDAFFAHRLRCAYHSLSGSWLRRTCSARSISHIRLSRYPRWSGTTISYRTGPTHSLEGFLATNHGCDLPHNESTPFSEAALLKLFRKPGRRQKKYSWVSWARRLSSSFSSSNLPKVCGYCTCQAQSTQARQTTTIVTLEFVLVPSTPRILFALALVLCTSVAATLLWVFLGPRLDGRPGTDSQSGRGGRVGSGVAVGVLGLLVQGAGLAGWVVFS